jgi:hypothetical protein
MANIDYSVTETSEGSFDLECNQFVTSVRKGETILLPSAVENCKLISDNATVLEVYL